MVWALRICLGLVVLAYAVWLGLPAIDALASGTTVAQVWSELTPSAEVYSQGAAGMLVATIALYAISALATAAGQTWAPGIFFLAFVGEIGLRLAVASGLAEPVAKALDLATRANEALLPLGVLVETTPLTLAIVLSLGLCILATGVWRGQKGAALTHVWTRPTAVGA